MFRQSETRTMRYEENCSHHVVGHSVQLAMVAAVLAATLTMPFGVTGVQAQELKTVSEKDVEKTLADWPAKPKENAKIVIKKYGLPNEATRTQLVWHNNGPWKTTILNRKEVQHDWPVKHTDMLEMVIDYRVPPEKVSQLAAFDGSVTVYRTRGELSAECDKEEMILLALNLSHDIITGEKNVDEARDFATKAKIAYFKGEKPSYMEKFQFEVPKGGTGFPDKEVFKIEDVKKK